MSKQTSVLLPQNEALLIKTSSRLFLGEALFETIKIQNNHCTHAKAHWERLNISARNCSIPFDVDFEQWVYYIQQSINYYQMSHGGLKLILSSGAASRGLDKQSHTSQLWAVPIMNLPVQKSFELALSPWRRDELNPLYAVKSINYLEAIMGQRQAMAMGMDDMLYQNLSGHILETSVANFYVILNHKIITPPIDDGVLSGVMRKEILKLCREMDIPVSEQSITKDMLNQSECAFISNSLMGISPVKRIDDVTYETEHKLLHQLMSFV